LTAVNADEPGHFRSPSQHASRFLRRLAFRNAGREAKIAYSVLVENQNPE
jgi:hypothetical protein